MKTTNARLLAPVLLATALAACATGGIPDAQKLELYRSHAGEPVSSFNFFGRLNGWTPLGDSALAVWTRPSEAFLLQLTGRCPDLDFAPAISLTSTQNRVHARFDKVIPLDRNPHSIPCHIAEIRPLDTRALRTAERELREGEVVADQPSGEAGT
ncbi:hypothetical protein E4582_01775 [Luteimonas yindakuii]|uniref:Lipoprotein n=1 Tax=Luteimonas yindakuii TaxID=2565782 RepID=A0A4Z1R504_9GAMM|nr:DUF6491 family protein [Luteimonas yindakuii]TKS53625.1 hypothetical protein E4582_01775 [Luteimonas yindakuii]